MEWSYFTFVWASCKEFCELTSWPRLVSPFHLLIEVYEIGKYLNRTQKDNLFGWSGVCWSHITLFRVHFPSFTSPNHLIVVEVSTNNSKPKKNDSLMTRKPINTCRMQNNVVYFNHIHIYYLHESNIKY